MNRVVINNGDGTVGVLIPAENCGLTLSQIIEKDVPQGKAFRVVATDKLPQDRTFRAAWTDDNPTDTVDVDMPRARGIHMGRIRGKRDAKLSSLDRDYLKADEQNNGQLKAQIAQAKQALRDLPETFDLSGATTPEELVTLWPTELD